MIIAIALGVYLTKDSAHPPVASDYVVKVGYLPTLSSKLLFEIANQKGFFEEEGVRIEAIEMQSSNLLADAIIRGDVHVVTRSSVMPVLNAELVEPGNVQIFAVTDYTSDKPFDSIIVKPDSPIQTIADLEGKNIGVFPGTTAKNMLKLLFSEEGIDSSGMDFVELPAQQHLTALAAGSIDALYTYEPSVSIGKDELQARVVFGSVFAHHLEHNPIAVSQINSRFVTEHPEEARRVVRAINRASDYMRDNDAEARIIARDVFNFSENVAAQITLPYSLRADDMGQASMSALIDVLVAAGELQEKIDVSGLFYRPR